MRVHHKLVVDELGAVSLYEAGPDAPFEGEDLLLGTPGPDELGARDRLLAALAALERTSPPVDLEST